jgi:hypothetical protein
MLQLPLPMDHPSRICDARCCHQVAASTQVSLSIAVQGTKGKELTFPVIHCISSFTHKPNTLSHSHCSLSVLRLSLTHSLARSLYSR